MSATMTANGKPQRKQLADQLDRLDGIIDALAEALPEAVSEAARDGTRAAVKDAILEILTNPELRALVQGVTVPVAPTPVAAPRVRVPGPWTRLKARIAAMRAAVTARCHATWSTLIAAVQLLQTVVPLKKVLFVGAVAGVAIAVLGYCCPHEITALLGGIGGACTAVAAQLGWCLRIPARRFGLL